MSGEAEIRTGRAIAGIKVFHRVRAVAEDGAFHVETGLAERFGQKLHGPFAARGDAGAADECLGEVNRMRNLHPRLLVAGR